MLLTGGQGQRLGGPKAFRPHPGGGTWASHLVAVHQSVFPDRPQWVLGDPLPHSPIHHLDDARQGPASALIAWAQSDHPPVTRWWVVACDQIHWTPDRLARWQDLAAAADPDGLAWVLARVGDHVQFLGGFLGHALLPTLAETQARSLWALHDLLPVHILETQGPEWRDIDHPEDLA